MLIYIFSRSFGLEVLESLSINISVYAIFYLAFAWSISQDFEFKSAEYFDTKNYDDLSKLISRSLFLSTITGLVVFVITFFFVPLLLGLYETDQITLHNIDVMMKFFSIAGLVYYPIWVYSRFFCSINYESPNSFSAVFSIIIFTLLLWWFTSIDFIDVGVGLAFTISALFNLGYKMVVFHFFNPVKELNKSFILKNALEGLFEFFKYSVKLGFMLFIAFLSFE